MNEKRFFGKPASNGVGEGTAFHFHRGADIEHTYEEESDYVERDIYRLESAIAAAQSESEGYLKGDSRLSSQESAILEAQALIIRDKGIIDKIFAYVQSGYSAEFSLKKVVDEYMTHLDSLNDDYLRERKQDVKNVGRRILQHLINTENYDGCYFTQPTIVISEEITPIELEKLNQPNLAGIVLASSGITSHEAVLSRSLEIPMIVGVEGAWEAIAHGAELIIDGASGLVLVHPTQDSRTQYVRVKEKQSCTFQKMLKRKNEKVVSLDGKRFHVGAIAGSFVDTRLAHSYGADHIGLLRTEFSLSTESDFPDEEEQTDMYSKIVESMEGKPVTIRTFDAGGDKQTFSGTPSKEANPYLGQRAIRLALKFEYDFRAQLRAVLRSSVHGPVKLLIPLITTVSEMKSVLRILNEEKEKLSTQGIAYNPDLPVGIMLEVPAAVFILPKLLRYIDFVTIGMNDLTQYILAADRNNPLVSSLYSPVEPSVLSAVQQAVQTCRRARIPVSICGEAVSHTEYLRLLLAMEPDEVNVYPQAVPMIKESIRYSSVEQEKILFARAVSCESSTEIETLIRDEIPSYAAEYGHSSNSR